MNQIISENRTKNYIKQLKGSFVFKGLAIFASFLSIPLMIKYLGVELYGVWSTLLSIVSWIVLFDIGIGNGLRNKISESLAKDNKEEAQSYISTAYILVGFISIILFIIFLFVSKFISWQMIFNTIILSNNELQTIVNLTVLFLFLNFWLSLINQIFNGLQKTSLVVFNQFLSNVLSLVSIVILYLFFESSLINLAFLYGFSLVLSNSILSFWFYKKNSEFIPEIKKYTRSYVKSISTLGFQFFIIQIAVIVIFSTDKILIIQLFGPEYVTSYDVLFKLFSTITVVHNILMAPLWAAYSDAYHRNDMEWLKKTIKQQLKIYFLVMLATMILVLFAKPLIAIWIGNDLNIDMPLIISMGLFIAVSIWNNIFAYFVNAIGKLKVQINTSIVAIIINIPLSIYFIKFLHMELQGIILATCISLSLFAIFGCIQTYKILKGIE